MAYGRRRRLVGNRRRVRRAFRRRPKAIGYTGTRKALVRSTNRYDSVRVRPGRVLTHSPLSRFLPPVQLVKMVFCDTFSLNATANPTGSAEQKIYPMMPCDPYNDASAANYPLQWDSAMLYYHRAIVQGAKVTIRPVVIAANVPSTANYWNAVIDDSQFPKYDFVSTTFDEISMLPGVPPLKYQGDAGSLRAGVNRNNVKIVKFSPRKFFRITKPMLNAKARNNDGAQDEGYWCGPTAATHSTAVTRPVIKLFAVGPTHSVQDPQPIYFHVKVEYVLLLLRKNEFNEDPIA